MKTKTKRELEFIVQDCHGIETGLSCRELQEFAVKLRRQAQKELKRRTA